MTNINDIKLEGNLVDLPQHIDDGYVLKLAVHYDSGSNEKVFFFPILIDEDRIPSTLEKGCGLQIKGTLKSRENTIYIDVNEIKVTSKGYVNISINNRKNDWLLEG